MKIQPTPINGATFRKTVKPSDKERINFLEHTLRRMQVHEILCDSRRPEFVKPHWWSTTQITRPHPCDCWLSEPFGSVGALEVLHQTVDKPE